MPYVSNHLVAHVKFRKRRCRRRPSPYRWAVETSVQRAHLHKAREDWRPAAFNVAISSASPTQRKAQSYQAGNIKGRRCSLLSMPSCVMLLIGTFLENDRTLDLSYFACVLNKNFFKVLDIQKQRIKEGSREYDSDFLNDVRRKFWSEVSKNTFSGSTTQAQRAGRLIKFCDQCDALERHLMPKTSSPRIRTSKRGMKRRLLHQVFDARSGTNWAHDRLEKAVERMLVGECRRRSQVDVLQQNGAQNDESQNDESQTLFKLVQILHRRGVDINRVCIHWHGDARESLLHNIVQSKRCLSSPFALKLAMLICENGDRNGNFSVKRQPPVTILSVAKAALHQELTPYQRQILRLIVFNLERAGAKT